MFVSKKPQTMDACDPTGMLFTKIRSLEPENGSKIIGYILLQDLSSRDLMRLALGPETLLQSLILKAKSDLGIPSNGFSTPSTPPSPSPLNPISRPINIHALSQPTPRIPGNGFLEFSRNPSSPSITSRLINSNHNTSSSPFQTGDLLLGSSVADGNGDTSGGGDLLDENQLGDYFSFLNDPSSKNDKFADQFGLSENNGDTHLHKRSFSASDACLGSAEERGLGLGHKPCLYFTKGFCKNGEACKFNHGGFGDNLDVDGGFGVGSPNKIDYIYQQQGEMMRMKAAHQQRLAAAQFMTGVSPVPYDKGANLFLHPRNLQRPTPMLLGEEGHWYGSPGRRERDDFMGMRFGDNTNSASRQIYLTFPADSSFKDEDVSNYFSIFGLVQDVRIPYQQKRMFGFVTFVHAETVRMILARGNPHFICDSRVLVKPYKEKGKIVEKRQQHLQHQLMERGNFSPCSSPSGIGSSGPFDFHLGPRMFYDTQEMMERKIDQTDLQQAIEFERRRFMNLQRPDSRNDSVHHHQLSVSIGSPLYFSSRINQNAMPQSENISEELVEDNADVIKLLFEPEANKTCVDDDNCGKSKESGTNSETYDLNKEQETNLESILPDTLFASPTKSFDTRQSDAVQENKSFSVSDTEPFQLALQ